MRAAVVLSAIGFALWAAHHAQVNGWMKRYLWAMFGANATTEIAYQWTRGLAYEVVYTLALNVILVTAAFLVWQWARLAPAKIRNWSLGLSLGYAAIAGNSLILQAKADWGYLPSQILTMTLCSVSLSVFGVVTLACATFWEPWRARAGRVLGTMWLVQSILYLLYSRGASFAPQAWAWIGEWLFAVIVIFGMIGAGFMLLLDRGLAHLALTESHR